MSMKALSRWLFVISYSLLLLSGCEQAFQRPSVRAFDQAEKNEKEGDYHAAVQFYEAAIDGTPKSADVHYRLALIYDDKLGNPLAATHHFQRYLEMSPHGAHAKDAREFIKQDELKIITTLSKGAFMTQDDAARLKNDNLELRRQLTEIRAQRTAPALAATGSPVQKPVPPGARTYTVQSGDTLASISRKHFKTAARWKDIQDANFNVLSGTVKLKPGMTLIIPGK